MSPYTRSLLALARVVRQVRPRPTFLTVPRGPMLWGSLTPRSVRCANCAAPLRAGRPIEVRRLTAGVYEHVRCPGVARVPGELGMTLERLLARSVGVSSGVVERIGG